MSQQEKGSRAASTFNEGEYLKNFKVIEDALEQNMRAEQPKTFGERDDVEPPFSSIEQWVNQRLVDEKLDLPEVLPAEEPPSAGEVPFSSSGQEPQAQPFPDSASQPEAVLYRQARRSKRRLQGRLGIWRLLPHIGHRRRHWLQKNSVRVLTVLILLLAVAALYLLRIRPRMVLAAMDEMAGATEAHASGDYEKAIPLYQQFLQSAPEAALRTIQAHYYLGCCYENLGDEVEAQREYRWVEQAYDRFCEQLPGEDRQRRQYDHNIPNVFANALFSLGQLAWQHEDREKAEQYFRRLLEEFPDYFFAPEAREQLDRLGGQPVRVPQTTETPPLETKG